MLVPSPPLSLTMANGDQTKLNRPLDVGATSANTYVVADTGNNRIREFGPSPIDDDP